MCTGCSHYYLDVQREQIDRRYLASTFVGSPDPRQDNPPFGQLITIEWKIPEEILERDPLIVFDLIYGDFTEGRFEYPVQHSWGHKSFEFLNPEYEEKKGIIAYRAQMILDDGEIYLTWEHQFWVNLINIEKGSYDEIESVE